MTISSPVRMIRGACSLALILLAVSMVRQPAHAQGSPDEWPLERQLQEGIFDPRLIRAALPAYVNVGERTGCLVEVYVTDPATWGDSARALFRHALPSHLELTHGCPAEPEVRVYRARHSAEELEEIQARIGMVIGEPGLRVRGFAAISGDSLVLIAHNRAALERARARLVREAGIPMASVSFQVPPGPEELDGPISPPREAFLAVLDSVAVHVHAVGNHATVDTSTLPASVGSAELRARGLRTLDRSHECGRVGIVSFMEPRQDTDGVYTFTVVEGIRPDWMASDHVYRVRCGPEGCCILHAMAGGGDYITGCSPAR